jgi:hypothetical protein
MLGISIDAYVQKYTNYWEPPYGFGFRFISKSGYERTLLRDLSFNARFGVDGSIGGSRHPGVSFREVNQPDSLHVIVSKHPIDRQSGANCEVHLDSVSPVLGREGDGSLRYDFGRVLQHIVTDQYHLNDVIVPSKDAGFAFGLRF